MIELHPLLSKQNGKMKNQHYKDKQTGKQAIEELEEELTVNDCVSACKWNMRKYQLRKKGQDAADMEKIIAYGNYQDSLLALKRIGLGEMLTSIAWTIAEKEFRYS